MLTSFDQLAQRDFNEVCSGPLPDKRTEVLSYHWQTKDEVVISPHVAISSSKYTYRIGSEKQGGAFFSSISIGRGSWISSSSTVAAGAAIGRGVLIGENSLVTSSVPDNKVATGVPAQEVRDRENRPGEAYFAR